MVGAALLAVTALLVAIAAFGPAGGADRPRRRSRWRAHRTL
jgi:hypothetical protein